MKNELSEKVRNLARFARAMRKIRLRFPEHARELDRALYDVGQKLESCSDPNCGCKQSLEEFHEQTNRLVEEELREKSYEFNESKIANSRRAVLRRDAA